MTGGALALASCAFVAVDELPRRVPSRTLATGKPGKASSANLRRASMARTCALYGVRSLSFKRGRRRMRVRLHLHSSEAPQTRPKHKRR